MIDLGVLGLDSLNGENSVKDMISDIESIYLNNLIHSFLEAES